MSKAVPESIKTFVDVLSYRASVQPDLLAFRFLSYSAVGVEEDTITYKALDQRARQIAQQLLKKCRPGDRALMLYPSGIDFIAAYFGCLYAGVIAVPGYPPKRNQKLGRLKSLVQNCQAKVAMTDLQTQSIAEPQFGEVAELKSLAWVISDNFVDDTAGDVALPQVQADDIAFLQYTSGSTGEPKGVMVTHSNLLANSRSIYIAMGHSHDTVVVGWLPLFHDMGLIGNVLQPIYGGSPSTLMSPTSFLQRPMRWLEAISKYRATTSGGPNFSYDLCVNSVKDEDLAQLDLHTWRVAFCGAEPIRPESLRAFSNKFSRCGFDPASHHACYGMAETTLLITGTEPGKGVHTTRFDEAELQQRKVVPLPANTTDGHELVSCGTTRYEQGVLIVDPDSLIRCADGQIGEIWAYGDSNAKGYWQRPDATAATFCAYMADGKQGPYLRTGDLGFMHEGELYIAGRLKDMLIIRGMNHYPQDIELTAFESDAAFMPNGAAAFTIEENGQEQLVIVLEVRRTHLRSFNPDVLARAVQQAVVLNHELQVRSVLFIKPGQLPKTSSGKVQRQNCKQQFIANQIETIGRVDKSADISINDVKQFDKEAWLKLPEPKKAAAVEDYIAHLFEAYAKLSTGTMQRDVAFIGYGLDSLALTQIAARVSEELDVNLQVQNLFECETIRLLAASLNEKLLDPASKRQRIVPLASASNRHPLSFAQQRMWFLMQYDASALYNVSGVLRIEGDLDIAALDKGFREIVRRHDALRTRFVLENFEPVQVVGSEIDWKLSVIDMSDRDQLELDAAIDRELDFVFDLSEDVLFRTAVYKRPDGAYSLVVCMHHIISDGRSVSVMMQELAALYAAYTQGRVSPLPALPIQYPDYAAWQREYLTGDVLQRQEDYWKSKLQGVMPIMLPTVKVRPTTQTYAGSSIALQLDAELTLQLKALSKGQGVTLYMTLLAAFGVLLHKYSGQDDICIGTPIASRTMVETKNLVGFFVNTLALRANYGGDPIFRELLQNIKTVTTEAYAHQDLPFEKVVDLVQTERDLTTSPLFQVMLVLQDMDMGKLSLPDLQVRKSAVVSKMSKFDITLELTEGADGLVGHLEYKTDLFDEPTIHKLSSHFKHLLAEIVRAPDSDLSSLSLLDADERHALLESWNDTAVDYPRNLTLQQLFEAQVAQTPDRTALVYEETKLTFAELNGKANQLAHHLRSLGVGPDVQVGICAERSIEMVVGLYAILKAGGAYVPFDPDYPKDRLAFMLEDCKPPVLLTQQHLLDRLPASNITTFCLDTQWSTVENKPATNPQNHTLDSNLAYVIFTSGSTGRPKGVGIEHAGIVNRLQWMQEAYQLTAADRVLQKTPFSFDVSVWEFFWPLLYGSTLVVAKPGGHQDPQYLAELIESQRITTLHFVPPMLEVFLSTADMQLCGSLKKIICSGQALPLELQRRFFAQLPSAELHNLYGPTEASVDVTYWQCRNESNLHCVPIGKPIANIQIYILDKHGNPMPTGVAGELHIAGIGLARGYLNRPDLTADKFIPNPFSKTPGARMYKSGDLARYLPDGNIEYLGRIDDQVKIRGFRIELGEIEAALAALPTVRDVVVIAREDVPGDKRLVAYIVSEQGVFNEDALRTHLTALMPAYMVPSAFIALDILPLSVNGKVDKKRLPKPDSKRLVNTEYVAPRNKLEEKLAAIWCELLKVDQIGIHHNFFELGGHSLLAMRMVAQIRDHWKIDFPIKRVFEAQELHALAALIGKAAESDTRPIERIPRGAPLQPSYAQQRLWIVNQIDDVAAQYNMPAAIDLSGKINVVALESAFNAFIARHEILRTVYSVKNGLPYQVILESAEFELKKIDLSDRQSPEQGNALKSLTNEEARKPFNLARDLMLRATLVTLSDKQHTLLVTMHHIASDGWSTVIMVKELEELYSAYVEHRNPSLPELVYQYADYAAWQRKTLAGHKLHALVSYWRDQLVQLPSVHNLPLDRARKAQPSHAGGGVEQTIPTAAVDSLNRLAQENGATLFMVLHAAFAGMLNRYSGEADIVIGTPVANRDLVELEPLVGFFVNTLVIRSDFSNNLSFREALQQSKSTLLNAYDHQELPFEMLVNELQVERSQSFNPLFQIMLVFQSSGENHLKLAGVEKASIRETAGTTKFDLTLNMVESNEGLKLSWEYAKDLFDETTIVRLASHFQNLLSGIVSAPDAPLRSLPILNDDEQQLLLESWNDTAKNYPGNQTLHQLFEAQVARTPDHTALVYEDTTLTYAELNTRANQLAHYLRARGVGPEVLVGICTERSIEMVVALYGVLKAGGGYVPFDPAYPKDRLAFMMEDAKPTVLLTQQHLLESLPASDIATLCLDAQWSYVQDQPTGNPENHTDEANLAYVIFTSGSTGRPKGVAVQHAGVVNLLLWMQEEYKLTADDRFLQKTPFSFDVSVSEFFWPLQEGATLVMARPGGHQDVDYLADVIREQRITAVDFVSPMLEVFLNSADMQSCASLRQIFCAGQALPLELQQRCLAKLPHVALHNLYGPTEASVYVTYWQCRDDSGLSSVPIGNPLANTQMYILDSHLNPVPVGVAGELHIAGIGLARGYLNRPDLTAEKFIPNPFSKTPGARMYKSGDLARYLPDGTIEYLGRIDDQVKIRGFRIELGEIENVLAGLPVVRDVIVMAREDVPGDKRIVAYIVAQQHGKEPSVAELRAALAGALPEYMVPAHFIFIDKVPLTPNGKVNRKSLPAPDIKSLSNADYVAPRTELETALAAIWTELLALDKISINANFFEIGGHSLFAVQMVSRVKDVLGLPVNIRDVFAHNTIASLAAYLAEQRSEQKALPHVSKRDDAGRIPLSLDQKPYWFLHQLEGGSHTYNIQFAMRLYGDLDVKALERSFNVLIERHESLRTRFPTVDGEPMQEIVAADAFKLQIVTIAGADIHAHVQSDFTYIFDLANELPVRARLLKVKDTDHVVTLVVHHAVADGWSLNILFKELVALYTSFSSGQQNPLPQPELQYGDYSQWQHKYVIGEYYDRQIAFWKKKLEGLSPLLNLPLDYSRPPVQSYRGREVPISLPVSLTARLNQYARGHNTTLFNLLLSGLAILLSRYGRTNDVPIGTAVANRIQQELEPLIGCFANTMVIRCKLNPSQNFEQLVESVSNEALDAFSNSSVPFDGVVEAVQPQRSLGIPPIFQVMFRLHNQEIEQTSTFADLRSELINLPVQSAKLDLNFSMRETPEGLKGVIEYATDIFSEQTVGRIAKHFQTVLEAAISNSTLPIENLSVVTQDEIEQVRLWNSTQIDYPKNECMHHLFERAVERTPNKLAYVCGDDRFTYAELNARANRLAHFLQSRGVGPEVRVGVSVERSTWAGIGALAVFKSGGTYVPLDVNYPKDRIARMLEVAKPQIILTLSSIAPLFDGMDTEVICLDTGWDAIQSQPISNPARIGADHSAYILFTSGTTGKPKGILVAHKSFRNMAVSQNWAGLYSPDIRVLQFASLSFSIALWGAFMAWVPGGTLYSVNAKQALPDEPLYDFLEENQITHATWPVSFLSTVPVDRMPHSLRTVISSAEPCNDAVVEKWTSTGVRFLNMYGNSEVSIGSTLYEYKQVGEKLTIGKAFPNTQMYLLDEHLLQVPIGVIAEIHTAGAGLATCYVDDPVATANSFIPNPFSDSRTARMYKTGDLGRYLPNGEIEFIGREDFQVSIRGFRVELTEIEDVLRAIPGVLEAVVNSHDDQQGLARLVCFYTQAGDNAVTATILRKAVSEKLPNYMVPSIYVPLDVMPLTPNRKIDRLALQSYPLNEGDDNQYVEPKTRLEKHLAKLWSDILAVEAVGTNQDFFELGGHSLLATRIVARIRSELHVELSLQQFFEHSTIERLAAVIEQSNVQYVENPIRILENRDNVPLSFAQQRLWFLDRYEENSNFYHMPTMLKIDGELDVDALNKTFVMLIERHEALRTNFIAHQGQGFQKIHPSIDWSMAVVELEGASAAEKEAQLATHIREQLNTSFNLETDALLRAVLYKLSDREYRLFVNMHHIISDGWSTVVMINEVSELYTACVSNRPHKLKALPVQYADYAVSQIEFLQGPVLNRQANYWSKKLNDLTTISLPLDFDRPRNQTYNGDQVAFAIDKSMVAALEDLSNRHGVTLFMTVLSAYKLMLAKYSGDTDICVGTPIANRVRPEIEPLIGFFANTLTLRSDLDGNPTFTALLQRVKQTTLEAYSNQDIPFEKVVDLVLKERDPSRSPLFQVSFGLQKNWMPNSIALPGVTMNFSPLENKTSKFDLVLEFVTSPDDGLAGTLEYNTDLFKHETVEAFVASLMNLLQQVVADSMRTLAELSLSSGQEIMRESLTLSDYPVLHALYGNASLATDNAIGYYLLDDSGVCVPRGAIGKLYFDVNGHGDLTTSFGERIVEIPFGSEQKKLFATRFTARQTPNGLVLLSSADNPAFINGRLVYPHAIEQRLLSRPDVQDCHVAVRRHAELGDQLVAYLVCESDEPDAGDFTQFLYDAGFDGIQIFAYVKVGAIPLNKYGKVNLKQLHKYAVHNQAIRQLWAEKVCAIEKISQAIVVSQVANEQQPVSHLLDLLPLEARGVGTSVTKTTKKTKKVDNESVSTVPAVIISEPILDVAGRPKILADMLIHAAQAHGDKAIEFYHADNSTASMSYAQLMHKAQCVLSGLRDSGLSAGSKVIFQFDRNEDFIVAFWACALGGYIPVPIAAAKTYRTSNAQTVKVAHAWNMMDNAIVLTGANTYDGVRNIAKLETIDQFNVVDITSMHACEPSNDFQNGASDDVALIMLTSGSTGLPKGVQLTHANLIGRTLGSSQLNGFHSDMVSLNWMALDHVGGIIYFHIRDTYHGATQIQADTDYILADPLRWLRLIDQHRVNITWAPNFAFALVVERREELNGMALDLSCLQFMLNGAEAVVPKTTQTFIELMQQFGMAEDTVKPVFGMSEISSGVTYSKRLQLTYGSDDTVFVSVGRPIPGVNMRIVDENDQPMTEGQSGRLQVSGVTVTKGYLGGPDINKDTFTADGWFKTGDLAFIQNGELTITGREKDVIIINGVNFYSHEIAEVVEAVPGVVVSYTGACAVRRNDSNSDQLAIFFNTAHKGDPLLALIKQIRLAVIEKIGINPSFIVPVEKDQVPKTEIGKIQLAKLALAFNRGQFDQGLRALDLLERNDNTLPDWSFSKTWIQKQLDNVVELPPSGATLVLTDTAGCAAALRVHGRLISVTHGPVYQEIDDAYQINPSMKEHYTQLVASLANRSITISRVVNLWDYEWDARDADALQARATLSDAIGLYSAWYLAQAFAELDAPPIMRWIWAARRAQCVGKNDLISPDKAAALALLKTLPKEFTWLKCHHVDFAGDDTVAHAAQLSHEIATFHAIDEVAYRDDKRLVVRLRKERRVIREKREMPLVMGGAYMISGGLGGIGYELAKLLLKQFNAKLLLVGRTPHDELPAEKKDMLDQLSNFGNVQYADADICNHAAVEAAVDNAEGKWKQKLAGVFHLAGLAHEEAMVTQPIHSLHKVLSAKTSGTRVLYNVCNRRTGTLFVNFSSINGFFGGSGMAAYNIGNRYQEAFVESVRENKNVRSICISWSLWHDTGMGSQYKQAESLSKALGFTPIKASKGLFSLLTVLYQGRRNVLIGLDDTKPNIRCLMTDIQPRGEQLVCYFAASEPGITNDVAAEVSLADEFGLPLNVQYVQVDALPLTDSGAIDVNALRRTFAQATSVRAERIAPRDEMEETLTRIATSVFGTGEPIGIKDNFFDVGATSVLIVKLHHEIQQQLEVQFPMVELFNSTSIEKLAIFLGQMGDQTQPTAADAARSAGQDRRAAMQRRNRSRERKTAR